MNCRYCGGIYMATERSCGGCGSPKTVVQTLLDVPAAPGHWSHSMTETVQRVAVASAVIGVAAVILSLVGLSLLAGFAVFFWVMPGSVIVLGMGAWQSSIGKVQERIRNFVLAGLLWIGVSIAMLLVLGLVVAG